MDSLMKNMTMEPNPDFDAPIAAIRPFSQNILSQMLNPIKVIPSQSGIPRDWRGLAELSGIASEKISFLETKEDPVSELVKIWCQSQDSGCKHFSDLRAFLGVLDRFDVVDDVHQSLVSDVQAYKEKVKNGAAKDAIVSPLDPSIEKNILTIEDSERIHQGLSLTKYHAFLLHSDDDSEFASQVVDKLENEYKLKLCLKERDLLPGVMFEHEIIGRLVAERCNRLLVIFSPNFLRSTANQFLVSYAQAFALESQQRKIIPCMYQECELPPSVRYSFCIRYTRAGKLWNFWDKLSYSLQSPPTDLPRQITAAKDVVTIDSNTRKEEVSHGSKLDSPSYWDAEKPTNSTALPSYSKSLDSGLTKEMNNSADADTYSIRSDVHLLTQPNGASSKWYQKIISPIKRKQKKDKAQLKQKALAE